MQLLPLPADSDAKTAILCCGDTIGQVGGDKYAWVSESVGDSAYWARSQCILCARVIVGLKKAGPPRNRRRVLPTPPLPPPESTHDFVGGKRGLRPLPIPSR